MIPPGATSPRASAALAALLTAAACIGCGGAESGADDASDVSNDPLESIEAAEIYRRGMLLAGAGDYVRAEQYLAAALDRGFPEERVLPALLNVCIRASRMVAALEYAEPYLARHPDQWPLRMLVATIHMGLDQPERARAQLERVLDDAAPEEPAEAHYFLGVVHRDSLEDAEDAAAHFRRYLALAPEGPHVDEARAALSPEERGLPRRVERDEVPPPAEGGEEEATSSNPEPERAGSSSDRAPSSEAPTMVSEEAS